MKTRLLHSYGKQDIEEYVWDKPDPSDDQIEIKTCLVGVCRSDIGAYAGWEQPMPFGMFGHEGLGIVNKVGKNLKSVVQEGDIVATFSDPAYSDFYNAKVGEFVKVPEVDPKYILQPVACGINILNETLYHRRGFKNPGKILLIGSGFLSTVMVQYAKSNNSTRNIEFDIVGNANIELWESLGCNRYNSVEEVTTKYDTVIDLSSKAENFDKIVNNLVQIEGLVCYAATPTNPITTNFFNACWNCLTFIMPSPRNKRFIQAMEQAELSIYKNELTVVNSLWTKGYARSNQYKDAFHEGMNRTREYSRGYIDFRI